MSGMPQEDSRETKLIERKWRAGYSERGKSGSEGGLCKPTVAIQQGDTCLPYCVAAAQIYNMLMDYHGDVTVKIDGIAASAASVIAMAGTKVLMSPTALMMIHNPLTVAFGNKEAMQKAMERALYLVKYETKQHDGSGQRNYGCSRGAGRLLDGR